MAEPERPAAQVHLLPGLIPRGALVGGVAVVVDVLRATTVMTHALAAGAEAIVPCAEVDEARAAAAALPAGTALLGGERQGLPIEGFDLGNSPAAYTPEVCRGKTVVMTTTNGTRAILAGLDADRVLVASFANLGATVAALGRQPGRVHVICSGTNGRVSYEDALLAGAVVTHLRRGGFTGQGGDDEAEIVAGLYESVEGLLASGTRALADVLALGRGGHRVREIGLSADLADAGRVDSAPVVAELRRDPLRVVRAG